MIANSYLGFPFEHYSKHLILDNQAHEPVHDVTLVMACLVVFGEDVSWPQEWPKGIKTSFSLIQSKYEKWVFD